MQSCHARQLNRDASYWQWTWRYRAEWRWEISLTVHPDFTSDNAAFLYLAHRMARDYVARAPDVVAIQPGKMRHDERPRFYLAACQPVPPRRKFRTALPGMSVNWGTRAPMIALPRSMAERGGRIDYVTSSYRNAAPPFSAEVGISAHAMFSKMVV